jgi:hypothetical protein
VQDLEPKFVGIKTYLPEVRRKRNQNRQNNELWRSRQQWVVLLRRDVEVQIRSGGEGE